MRAPGSNLTNNKLFIDSVTGEHDKSIADIGQADIQVNQVIVHENFNRRNLQNDICILKTDHMRLYARMGMVDRACLPDKNSEHPPPGTDRTVQNPNQGTADSF